MSFTFENYKEYCKANGLKESHYNSLAKFKAYCKGK